MKPVLMALILAGCASTPATDPYQNPEALAPLTCASKAQCDHYWQRAQAWVASNSAYRVRISTDVLVETFGPLRSETGLAYRIIRTPGSDQDARITISAMCDNIFGCTPGRGEAIASFKRFVKQ